MKYTEGQKEALQSYVDFGFKRINPILWGNVTNLLDGKCETLGDIHPKDKFDYIAKQVNRAMDIYESMRPLEQEKTLHRYGDVNNFTDIGEGDELSFKGFTSASTEEGKISKLDKGIKFEISLPKGTRVHDMTQVAAECNFKYSYDEEEILIPPMSYKVSDIYESDDSKKMVKISGAGEENVYVVILRALDGIKNFYPSYTGVHEKIDEIISAVKARMERIQGVVTSVN